MLMLLKPEHKPESTMLVQDAELRPLSALLLHLPGEMAPPTHLRTPSMI